jgi:flagellar capping protein FliD
MKTLPTQTRLRELFNYDIDSGLLTWKVRTNNVVKVGDATKSYNNRGYGHTSCDGRRYKTHRLIMKWVYGDFDEQKEVDHINGNPSDNSIENIRLVDRKTQMRNLARHSNNTSGQTGVYWNKHGDKWQSYITVNKTLKYLGLFTEKADAIKARKEAEKEHGFHPNHGRII